MAEVITIDGPQAEGGGQVLRSSLALSLVTGRPFVIEKIRAGRKKPGLLQQHLTAVLAAAEVGGAEVEGAALGPQRLMFRHGTIRCGDPIYQSLSRSSHNPRLDIITIMKSFA
jgi:RNA 3'-terminal phosphate cyclase (ATP)